MSKQTHQLFWSRKKKVEPNPTNFGARLRALIDRKGLTLTQFVEQFGISESQLHNWLKRAAPPLEKHWEPLAKFFGVSTGYVAFGTPEKAEPVAEEAAAAYGPAGELRGEIEALHREVLARAGDDVGRLGWLREELRALTMRAPWPLSSGESHGVALAKYLGERDAFKKAGEILARQEHGNPPKAKSS